MLNFFFLLQHSGKDDACILRELYTPDHFTEFQSASNPNWFVAFNSRGMKLAGNVRSNAALRGKRNSTTAASSSSPSPPPSSSSPSSRCRQFIKTNFHHYLDPTTSADGGEQPAASAAGGTGHRRRHGPPLIGYEQYESLRRLTDEGRT